MAIRARHRAVQRGIGGFGLAEYRAYAIGPDGHIASWVPLICEDDRAAIDKAKESFHGQIAELWCGARLVARLPTDQDSD